MEGSWIRGFGSWLASVEDGFVSRAVPARLVDFTNRVRLKGFVLAFLFI